jgi:hypothetical protein
MWQSDLNWQDVHRRTNVLLLYVHIQPIISSGSQAEGKLKD